VRYDNAFSLIREWVTVTVNVKTSFEQQFGQLPAILHDCGDDHWLKFADNAPTLCQNLDKEYLFRAKYCFALSDFVAESCIYLTDVFEHVFVPDGPSYRSLEHYRDLILALDKCTDENKFMISIRQLRKSMMVSIAVTDLLNQQTVQQSFTLLSELSDLLILAANKMATRQIGKVFGSPVGHDGQPMPLVILGMGKLGGEELNFSSDIDLIFCFAHSGQTTGGRKSIEHQLYFTKVAQKLIHYLHHHSGDGFVFRVDMRLRPFGDSGPLVLSFSAMEDYYQEQGRDWERYAMLKSRAIAAGGVEYIEELTRLLRPFVYRRYIDFSVIDSLRNMKLLISGEARRKDTGVNIKLGFGGIREVEFIAQALQLIRGGREKQLQVRPLLLALKRLNEINDLDDNQYEKLSNCYLQLRQCEHYLQQFNDQQTQWLPTDALNQQRLAFLFGHQQWPDCLVYISDVMNTIHQEFIQIIDDDSEEKSQQLSPFEVFWQLLDGNNDEQNNDQSLWSWLDSDEQDLFIKRLSVFKADCLKRSIGGRGREVLDHLIPQLLSDFGQAKEKLPTLERVLTVIGKISSRTAYLELLNENTGALNQLVKLCSQSRWIAEQLSYQPILLDELIDPRVLYHPTAPHLYQVQLNEHMIRVPEDDLEQQLESLRHFKLSQQLHIAAADISGVLSVDKVSYHLTVLAESIMHCVVNIAWKQMAVRYGEPAGRDFTNKGFGVIAYGKMGGIELGYDSDLDVVFVHNCDSKETTNGRKSIDSRQFYLKLAQRIMHIFTSRTVSGILYELDTRIRPQGNSGLLACHINTYDVYLREDAWTWEHQALVRTRMVYGASEQQQQFADIRSSLLKNKRDLTQLKKDVVDMRVKMRDNLARSIDFLFDLKQGLGGIADIEFITQYLVLAHAWQHSELTCHSSNIDLFSLFVKYDIISKAQAKTLGHSYRQLRDIYHRLTLQKEDKLTDNEYARAMSVEIQQIWQVVFDD
jgi:glutamate-ammonia-ligase adenylyltransferase